MSVINWPPGSGIRDYGSVPIRIQTKYLRIHNLNFCKPREVVAKKNVTLKNFLLFQVVFIDLEYGGPAPAAFDIANHMCEFVGCEGELDYERWFPGRSYQLDWLTLYLHEFNRIQDKEPPSESQVCDLRTVKDNQRGIGEGSYLFMQFQGDWLVYAQCFGSVFIESGSGLFTGSGSRLLLNTDQSGSSSSHHLIIHHFS